MRSLSIILPVIILFSSQIFAAEEEQSAEQEKSFNIKFSGYIKNDFFYDSRQTVAAREGQVLLWPAPKHPDANGNDINAKSGLNFLALQSRLRVEVTGPDVLGARPSGLIEGDFIAATNEIIAHFRLRHAFIKLSWDNTELLTGQYWNPLFITDCFPTTVSFNTGAPIQGIARNPQIRITHKVGGLRLLAAAITQRGFASTGPEGKSSVYLRNAVIPEMHAQIHYSSRHIVIGGGLAYKSIVPRLSSTVDGQVYQVEESVAGLSALGFVKISTAPLTMKFQARYGENNTDLLTPGGYAVSEIVNQETQERLYTPMTNTSFWGDVETNGKKLQFGLFARMLKNHGTKERMSESPSGEKVIYGFGQDIESLYRFSPRVVYNIDQLRLGMETELTVANYGKNQDLNWKPQQIQRVENCRVLLAVYYFF